MAINHLYQRWPAVTIFFCWALLVAGNSAFSSAVVKRGSLLSKENLLLKKRRNNQVDIANDIYRSILHFLENRIVRFSYLSF